MVSTESINEVVLCPAFLKHRLNPLSSLFVLAVSPWCGYCLSDCLLYGGSSMRVQTSMCVWVLIVGWQCAIIIVRGRGAVWSEKFCVMRAWGWERGSDKDSKIGKGERYGWRRREAGGVNSWHSRHSLPEIAVAFLSPVLSALHPFFSSLPSTAICRDLQTQASEACDACQSKNYSKHRSSGCSSLHKQQCWGMTTQTED